MALKRKKQQSLSALQICHHPTSQVSIWSLLQSLGVTSFVLWTHHDPLLYRRFSLQRRHLPCRWYGLFCPRIQSVRFIFCLKSLGVCTILLRWTVFRVGWISLQRTRGAVNCLRSLLNTQMFRILLYTPCFFGHKANCLNLTLWGHLQSQTTSVFIVK